MDVNLTLDQLIEAVGGTCSIDSSFCVEKVASLEAAGPNDLTVLIDPDEDIVFDPIPPDVIRASRAGIILSRKPLISGKHYWLVDDVLVAFEKLITFISSVQGQGLSEIGHSAQATVSEQATIGKEVTIGPGAVIEAGADIGDRSAISAQVYIGRGCRIGRDTLLYPGVKILERCIIGDRAILHAGVVVGSDGFSYRITKQGLQKIPQIGIVRIGSDVEIGANTCIDRAAFAETVIGDCVKIDNVVHISHNVNIGSGTAILAQAVIAGSVNIGKGCQIGGQVAIKDHVQIGNYVKIVSRSGVMKNISDGEVVAGSPSMPFSKWKRLMVFLGNFPEIIKTLNNLKEQAEKLQAKKPFWQRFFSARK